MKTSKYQVQEKLAALSVLLLKKNAQTVALKEKKYNLKIYLKKLRNALRC